MSEVKKSFSSVAKRSLLWLWRATYGWFLLSLFLVVFFAIVNPPGGLYMLSESNRLDGLEREWVDLEDMGLDVPRSVVAAEDANFCLHHGIDFDALWEAIDDGATRGASTLTQQVAKNLYLWHGRSYLRKGLEAGFALMIDTVWTKRRILEVYLNIAEFDEGVFGAGAASQSYFNKPVSDLSLTQAARLAAVLPDPKGRSASQPSAFVKKRGRANASGAETIAADGRAACFEMVESAGFSWQ